MPTLPSRAVVVCLLLTALSPRGAAASDPAYPQVHVGGLLQPQALLEEDAPGVASHTLRFTPFVRRARLAVHGAVQPHFNFFVQLDVPNTGLRNDWTPRFFLNDVLLEFDVAPWLQIDAGLLLLPTSHAAASGTPLTLGINAPQIFFSQEVGAIADDETLIPSQQALRDVGVMARGVVAERRLEYRLALTAGLSKFVGGTSLNPHAIPRFSGRLVYAFLEQVAGPTFRGFFYPGVALQDDGDRLISPKRLVNLGLSASFQPSVVARADGGTAPFALLDVDVFVDLPWGDAQQAVTGQVDYAIYRLDANAAALRHIVFAEAGVRYRRLEPLAAVEFIRDQVGTLGDTLYWRVGCNWWIAGHAANLKIDGGARRQITATAANPGYSFIGHVATQMFF